MHFREASCKSCNIRVTFLLHTAHLSVSPSCKEVCILQMPQTSLALLRIMLQVHLHQAHSVCTRCWPQKLKRSGCKLLSWLLARPSTWSQAPPTPSCLAPGCSYGGPTSMVPPRGADHLEQPCRPCPLASLTLAKPCSAAVILVMMPGLRISFQTLLTGMIAQ